MERFDFTVNDGMADAVPEELDQLTNRQIAMVHDAVQRIKKDTETEARATHMEWFNTGILPVLKEYAELTSSILEVEREGATLMTAVLSNACGLDMSSDFRSLYMAVMAATHIHIDTKDGVPVMILTYDANCF